MTEEQRIIGKITKLSERGWGFISTPEIKFTRIFFHWSGLAQNTLNFTELETGMKVEFTPVNFPDSGYRALRIRVIENEKDSVENSTRDSKENGG